MLDFMRIASLLFPFYFKIPEKLIDYLLLRLAIFLSVEVELSCKSKLTYDVFIEFVSLLVMPSNCSSIIYISLYGLSLRIRELLRYPFSSKTNDDEISASAVTFVELLSNVLLASMVS